MYIALLRYGELTLKGKNRSFFLCKLRKRLYEIFGNIDGIKIEVNSTRTFLYFNLPFLSNEFKLNIIEKTKRIFGLSSISFGILCSNKLEVIKKETLELLIQHEYKGKTIKIITNRAYKNYYLDSLSISKTVSSYIFKFIGDSIDARMKNADYHIYIEIYDNKCAVVINKISLSGGMPNGSLGKGLLMISGGIDSPVAGYLALRKGIELSAVHFAMPPYTSQKSEDKVKSIVQVLSKYQSKISLFTVDITKLQLEVKKNFISKYNTIILRSFMYLISYSIARYHQYSILVNGESLGQVASQTLESISCLHSLVDMPIFQPVSALEKQEIINIAKKIGTFSLSIQPFEDCCSIFLPRNPITRPKKNNLLKELCKIDIEKFSSYVSIKTETIYYSPNKIYF